MATTIKFELSYGQLAVFAAVLSQPFNDWTDEYVAQGFTWRDGSVSFRSIAESGPHQVEIAVLDAIGELHPDAKRAIEVPFEIPPDGGIEVGSISETIPISLPPGTFLLRCEFLQPANEAGERVRLTFARQDQPHFAVVRADTDLSPGNNLLTTAHAAPY